MTVPFLPNRSRYNIVTMQPGWTYHTMNSGGLTGERPRTAALNEDQTDPTVESGRARYLTLSKGGLFHLNAAYKRPIMVEAVDKSGAGTINTAQLVLFSNPATVSRDIAALLAASPFVPFMVAPNEMIKIISTAGTIGFLMRFLDEGAFE